MPSAIPRTTKDTGGEDGRLSIAVLQDWASVECLRSEWDAILERNQNLTIFSTPEWLGAWWRAYGAGRQLYCMTFRDQQGRLVALLPLYLARARLGSLMSAQCLQLVGDGSGDSDNLDFIVLPGFERAAASALLQHLAAHENLWSICCLNCMASASTATEALQQALETRRWKLTSSTLPWSAVLLPETWDAYLKQLSAKERAKVGNRLRRLETRHRTRFYKCATQEDVPSFLEKLFDLHQKRWQLRGETGSFASLERRRFYDDMASQFLSRNWLELWLFEIDGVPVAAQYGFRYADTVYSLQEGFDPDYSSDSVGYVLRSYALRQFIEAGVRRYDFLAGQNESKLRWGGVGGNYVNLQFARPRSWGALFLALVRSSQSSIAWLKRSLSSRIVEFIAEIRKRARKAPSPERGESSLSNPGSE